MLKETVINSTIIPLTESVREREDFNEDFVIGRDMYEDTREDVALFRQSISTIRQYKLRTGREFFSDYAKATKKFIDLVSLMESSGITSETAEELDEYGMTSAEQLEMLNVIADPEINQFIMDLIPCMYTEIKDGKFIQNEDTASRAEDSSWIMDLVNVTFFAKVFAEISANAGNNAQKKAMLRVVK